MEPLSGGMRTKKSLDHKYAASESSDQTAQMHGAVHPCYMSWLFIYTVFTLNIKILPYLI